MNNNINDDDNDFGMDVVGLVVPAVAAAPQPRRAEAGVGALAPAPVIILPPQVPGAAPGAPPPVLALPDGSTVDNLRSISLTAFGAFYKGVMRTPVGAVRAVGVKVSSVAHAEGFRRLRDGADSLEDIHTEAAALVTMAAARVPHIPALYVEGLATDGINYYIVQELVQPGAALSSLPAPLAEGEAKALLRAMVAATATMHALHLTNNDISPENTLLWEPAPGQFSAKLIDFGASRRVAPGTPTPSQRFAGKAYLIPKEVYEGECVYSTAGDMWCIGTTALTLLVGRAALLCAADDFFRYGMWTLRYQGLRAWRDFVAAYAVPLDGGVAARHLEALSNEGMDFLERLIVVDPARRMTAAEALAHPFLAQ